MRWRLQSLLPASMNRAMRRHLFRARDSKRKGLTRKARFLRLNATLLVVVFAGAFRSSHQKSRSRSLYYSSLRRKDQPAQDSINGDAGNRVHVRRSEYSTHSAHQQKRPSQSPLLTNTNKQLDWENRDSPQNDTSLNTTNLRRVEMKKEHLDLIELMKLDGRRGDETLGTSCIKETESLWSVRNERMLREVMHRIRNKKPFGWIRFADGDMNHLDDSSRASRRLRRAISAWPSLPNLVVSVGEWWLCTQKFADIWHRHFQTKIFRGYIFHSGCFYLPMGTPDDDDRDMWAEKDIKGWVRTAYDANVTSVLVGPRPLVGIPWLSGDLTAEQHV